MDKIPKNSKSTKDTYYAALKKLQICLLKLRKVILSKFKAVNNSFANEIVRLCPYKDTVCVLISATKF